MIIKSRAVLEKFRPEFAKDFHAWKFQINVQLEYIGPLPEENSHKRYEIYVFAVYQHGELVDSGTIEWDSRNGVLTYGQAAQVIVLQFKPSK